MKKIISILTAVFMITSLTAAYASDNVYPASLSAITENVTGAITGTKLNISKENAVLTSQIATHPSFGDIYAVIDGVGMTYDNLRDQNYDGGNSNRWTSLSASLTGTITFEFTEAQTFNTIKWSEVRKVIKKVTVKAYTESTDEAPAATAAAEFNDELDDPNCKFGRMAALDKTVTAKKVEFIIKDASLLNKVVSIAEIEFWNDSAAVTEEIVTPPFYSNKTAYGGDIKKIMDGVKYQADGSSTLGLPDRWVVPTGTMPTIIFNFYSNDITFDTINYWEVRSQLKAYTITCYKDGAQVYNKEFTSTDTSNISTTYSKSIFMGERITADKVCLKVTGNAGSGVLSFAEFEFTDTKVPITITDADGQNLDNQFNGSLLKNAFDGLYDNTPDDLSTTYRYQFLAYKLGCVKNDGVDDFNVKVPITIQFDLGENKTFNYAELSELRCIFGEIEVYVSTDGSVWTKAGTMPKMPWSGSLSTEYIHSVSFEPVTARYVKYIITEMATYDDFTDAQRTANINEISVCNYDTAKTAIYPIRVFGKPLDESNSMVYSYTKNGEVNYALRNLVNTNAVLNNSGEGEKTYMIVLAQYSAEDNSLVNAALKKVTLSPGQSTIQNVVLNSGLEVQDIYGSRLACFVWDGETLEPFVAAQEYTQPDNR